MSWADPYIQLLKLGQTVKFRPFGTSMQPRIKSGALVTVEPLTPDVELKVGEVVLVRVHGSVYLHLVKAVSSRQGEGSFLIGNNRGFINGWAVRQNVYGRCVAIEP